MDRMKQPYIESYATLAGFLATVALLGGCAVLGADDVRRTNITVPSIEDTPCAFSPETTTVTVPENGGAMSILLKIDGVNYGTCDKSARKYVSGLNPGQNLFAPHVGEAFDIPVSASYNAGAQG